MEQRHILDTHYPKPTVPLIKILCSCTTFEGSCHLSGSHGNFHSPLITIERGTNLLHLEGEWIPPKKKKKHLIYIVSRIRSQAVGGRVRARLLKIADISMVPMNYSTVILSGLKAE